MLKKSDTDIEQFIPLFAKAEVPVAFLVPTPTGLKKSIMDATASVREFLKESGLHDYSSQGQGPECKVKIPAFLVGYDGLIQSQASLYRPVTKNGDPRIWFSNLSKYCVPYNLLAIIAIDNTLYVFNLSDENIVFGLKHGGFPASILQNASENEKAIANELLAKLQYIHSLGFIKSVTPGDPGVGDTLEHALGIKRNNSQKPDYKGIELKTTRVTKNGKPRSKTRNTLFAKVPNVGMTYRQIVEKYGKDQIPRNSTTRRRQLYETFRCSRPNAYDLQLHVDEKTDELEILHVDKQKNDFVSAWDMEGLRNTLLTKHHETFWIKAVSEVRDGVEYFRYDTVLHTKNPNTSLLEPLLETDKITVDLAAHIDPVSGKWRDHGALFKMNPDDIPLLLGEPVQHQL